MIFDDAVEKDFPLIRDYFLRNSKHMRISVLVTYQSLFVSNSSEWRSINQNTDFLILFYMIRCNHQMSLLARQLTTNAKDCKSFLELYNTLVAQPYQYLVIDFRPNAPFRFLSNVCQEKSSFTEVYSF